MYFWAESDIYIYVSDYFVDTVVLLHAIKYIVTSQNVGDYI